MISKFLSAVLFLVSFSVTLQADDVLFRKKQQVLAAERGSAFLKTKMPKHTHNIVSAGQLIKVNRSGKYINHSKINIKNISDEHIFGLVSLIDSSGKILRDFVIEFSLAPGAIKQTQAEFRIPLDLKAGDILKVVNRSFTISTDHVSKRVPIEIVPIGKKNALELIFERISD